MKNRLTRYEPGWLTELVRLGLCSNEEARAAMRRVSEAAVAELQRRRQRKKRKD